MTPSVAPQGHGDSLIPDSQGPLPASPFIPARLSDYRVLAEELRLRNQVAALLERGKLVPTKLKRLVDPADPVIRRAELVAAGIQDPTLAPLTALELIKQGVIFSLKLLLELYLEAGKAGGTRVQGDIREELRKSLFRDLENGAKADADTLFLVGLRLEDPVVATAMEKGALRKSKQVYEGLPADILEIASGVQRIEAMSQQNATTELWHLTLRKGEPIDWALELLESAICIREPGTGKTILDPVSYELIGLSSGEVRRLLRTPNGRMHLLKKFRILILRKRAALSEEEVMEMGYPE